LPRAHRPNRRLGTEPTAVHARARLETGREQAPGVRLPPLQRSRRGLHSAPGSQFRGEGRPASKPQQAMLDLTTGGLLAVADIFVAAKVGSPSAGRAEDRAAVFDSEGGFRWPTPVVYESAPRARGVGVFAETAAARLRMTPTAATLRPASPARSAIPLMLPRRLQTEDWWELIPRRRDGTRWPSSTCRAPSSTSLVGNRRRSGRSPHRWPDLGRENETIAVPTNLAASAVVDVGRAHGHLRDVCGGIGRSRGGV